MGRVVTFAAAWVAAAAVAVAVAWQGVGIVTSQVTDDRPAALASGEVRQLAEGARTTTTVPAPAVPVTTAPSVSFPGATTTALPPAPATVPLTTTTAPATATAPTPATTTTVPVAAETRTYNVVGGSVSLRFAPTGVTVVWATPNSGFEVDVEPENTNGVRVRFESDAHRSRVDGWWDGGPRDDVREVPR